MRKITVDSSGFTTSVFGRWFEEKWGSKTKKEGRRLWRKAHVMSGVKTNIITAVKTTKGNSADTTQFHDLLDNTSTTFQVREVSADMAYLSRQNLEQVSKLGGIPFIPFKRSSVGTARGSYVWRRAYTAFSEHYDEFMLHYHKRSNAETVFSMIKRKFSMNLRTKHETAQDNEILCKCLCHNICVLIHECYELNIDINLEEHLPQIENVKNSATFKDYFCTQSQEVCT